MISKNTVSEARSLAGVNKNGFSDVYVKIKIGKQKQKTKVLDDTVNPICTYESD